MRISIRAIGVAVALVAAGGAGFASAALLWPHSASSANPSASSSPSPSPSPTPSPSASASPSPSPSPSFDPGAHSIDDPESIWIVVNKTRPLDPIDFAPTDVDDIAPIPNGAWQNMRTEAADAIRELYAAAKADGASFKVATAQRTYGEQRVIYQRWVNENGQSWADRSSARGGYSEHQTGWALDIYDSDECRLQYCFATEPAGLWVVEHAWEYGFILRYPKDSEKITGFIWEPWHLRYVGIELATEMHEKGITIIEEVFGLPPAPSYV